MVKDSEAKAKLFGAMTRLAKDETLQEKFKTNIAKYAVTNADEVIAKEIFKKTISSNSHNGERLE
jgi:UDP-N-acetylglucosamine--N-acetylmuramyl-(pentapeptide) pyrophosphoryl-undecaprenol N-acetylglucosamine transferase